MSDIRLQEIVTRAVVGRGDHRVVWSHAAPAEGADNVLGVHVSKFSLSVEDGDGEPTVRVSATLELWCTSGAESRVHRITCTHRQPTPIRLNARVVGETEVTATLVRGVRCTEADVRDGELNLTMEADVVVEVSGMARFWVKAYDLSDELDASESGDSLGETSSASHSESSSDYERGEEESGSGLEYDEMDEYATLRANEEVRPQPSVLVVDDLQPGREFQPRRGSVISHFQQSASPSRVSIVQGH